MMILDREKMGYLSDLLRFFVTKDRRQHTDECVSEAQKIARELFPPIASSDDPIFQLIAALNVMAAEGVEHTEYLAARDLAQQLFPPMAKPLVWDENGNKDYQITQVRHPNHSVFICGPTLGYLIDGEFLSVDAARAACESHHQSRFLEQLA